MQQTNETVDLSSLIDNAELPDNPDAGRKSSIDYSKSPIPEMLKPDLTSMKIVDEIIVSVDEKPEDDNVKTWATINGMLALMKAKNLALRVMPGDEEKDWFTKAYADKGGKIIYYKPYRSYGETETGRDGNRKLYTNNYPAAMDVILPDAYKIAAYVWGTNKDNPQMLQINMYPKRKLWEAIYSHRCLGIDLNKKVKFIVAFTSDGASNSNELSWSTKNYGLKTAVNYAEKFDIKIFNLGSKHGMRALYNILSKDDKLASNTQVDTNTDENPDVVTEDGDSSTSVTEF